MQTDLLNYICCCHCKGILSLRDDQREGEEIVSATLWCEGCASSYPVRGGIPRFVPAHLREDVRLNVRNFGYEWSWLSSPSEIHKTEFLSYLQPATAERLAGKVVLDAGCGMGKFLRCSASYGPKAIVGVDLADESVERAHRNSKGLPGVHVVQADLYNLPFKTCFDFIYSIGVLHHLPQPEQGFKELVARLKTGGQIFAWVYGYEGNEIYIRWCDPLRRFTSRLPLALSKSIAFASAAIIWIIILGVYVPLERIGFMKLPFHRYFLYFRGLGFFFFWGTVFDKMIPTISHYCRRQEFSSWFSNANVVLEKLFHRNGNSWSGLGVKP